MLKSMLVLSLLIHAGVGFAARAAPWCEAYLTGYAALPTQVFFEKEIFGRAFRLHQTFEVPADVREMFGISVLRRAAMVTARLRLSGDPDFPVVLTVDLYDGINVAELRLPDAQPFAWSSRGANRYGFATDPDPRGDRIYVSAAVGRPGRFNLEVGLDRAADVPAAARRLRTSAITYARLPVFNFQSLIAATSLNPSPPNSRDE